LSLRRRTLFKVFLSRNLTETRAAPYDQRGVMTAWQTSSLLCIHTAEADTGRLKTRDHNYSKGGHRETYFSVRVSCMSISNSFLRHLCVLLYYRLRVLWLVDETK